MTGNVRRLGVRPDAPTLEQARARVRLEGAALIIAAKAAYTRSLHAEAATVIALACEVARAVLGREAEASDAVLRDIARGALARVRRAEVVVLRVHPDDFAAARDAAQSWLPEGMQSAELHVRADLTVDRGGVVVDTELGRVDARLDVQIEEVARILEGRRPVV